VLSFADPDSPDAACALGPDGNPVITQRPGDVSALCATFYLLARSALSPGDSARPISELAAQAAGHAPGSPA
jgi:hypothetical protein